MPTAPSGFSYYKTITISNTYVDSALSSFPVLVKITSDSDIGGRAASTGVNLRFALSDGTLLNYERQSFTVSGGAATAIYWVQVPTVASAGSTVIYCWYDNSGASDGQNISATWDSNYKLVWHLEQDPAGGAPQVSDSTSNSKNGTVAGAPTRMAEKVGNGYKFAGSSDKVSVSGGGNPLNGQAAFTVEAIIINTKFVFQSPFFATAMAGDGYNLTSDNGDGFINFRKLIGFGGGVATSDSALTDGTLYHLAGVVENDGTVKLYVNGAVQTITGSKTGAISDTTDFKIGTPSSSSFPIHEDEVRLSATPRNAAWIKFTYRNIFESDNCMTWGSEQSAGGSVGSGWYYNQLLRGAA